MEIKVKNIISKYLINSKNNIELLIEAEKKHIILSSQLLVKTINKNKKILICGNGGSASDAQHFAAELIGRFKKNRRSFPAISLNTDTSAITAIGNDYDFSKIFSRQVEGIGNKEDVLFAISTSGNSKNVIEAATLARKKKLKVISLTGANKSRLEKHSDICIKVQSNITSHIQELHIVIIHLLCTLIEFKILEKK
ncbi:MAG: phosphoheptose isomerase [Rickettsiales bacterium]|nr:phosphoheptose isomerase [Rickettsiales bacterium]